MHIERACSVFKLPQRGRCMRDMYISLVELWCWCCRSQGRDGHDVGEPTSPGREAPGLRRGSSVQQLLSGNCEDLVTIPK